MITLSRKDLPSQISTLQSETTALQDPTQMSDALATKLGYKQYNMSTAALTNISSVSFAYGIPYQVQDGSWRLKFNIRANGTGSFDTASLQLVGVTFKSNGDHQAFSAAFVGGAVGQFRYTYAQAGTSVLEAGYENAAAYAFVLMSGDVALESKPSWAA